MDSTERDRLIKALEEMDPSDEYHDDERGRWEHDMAPGYYAAIDRAVHLVAGRIAKWTDPKPTKN